MRKTDWPTKLPKEYNEGFNKGEKWYESGHDIPLEDAECKYKETSDEWFAFQRSFKKDYYKIKNNNP